MLAAAHSHIHAIELHGTWQGALAQCKDMYYGCNVVKRVRKVGLALLVEWRAHTTVLALYKGGVSSLCNSCMTSGEQHVSQGWPQHMSWSFVHVHILTQKVGLSAVPALQIAGFSSFTNLAMLSMASNKLGDGASFEMTSLAGLLSSGSLEGLRGNAGGTASRGQHSIMFPLLQVLRLHENSIRSIQGLQLFGFTGKLLMSSLCCLCCSSACSKK